MISMRMATVFAIIFEAYITHISRLTVASAQDKLVSFVPVSCREGSRTGDVVSPRDAFDGYRFDNAGDTSSVRMG